MACRTACLPRIAGIYSRETCPCPRVAQPCLAKSHSTHGFASSLPCCQPPQPVHCRPVPELPSPPQGLHDVTNHGLMAGKRTIRFRATEGVNNTGQHPAKKAAAWRLLLQPPIPKAIAPPIYQFLVLQLHQSLPFGGDVGVNQSQALFNLSNIMIRHFSNGK